MFRSNEKHAWKWTSLATTSLMAMTLAVGCNNNKTNEHPDVKDNVTTALKNANLGDVNVSQDRDKGVLSLSGNVQTQDQKQQAESIVQQNAPGYTVADEIGVRPAGDEGQAKSVASNLDDGIENNFKAAIKGHKTLDDQDISGNAKNGTLVIKGSVKTEAEKREAEALAKKVPNVQQVVNEIEVKGHKHSSATSAKAGGM